MKKNNKQKIDGIHGKIFINYHGETLLCRGRLEFLKAVDELGSISAAAKRMKYSYRKAWSLVEKTNRSAGTVIIETNTGGAGGGGAKLTENGRILVELFSGFLSENRILTDRMWSEFLQRFGETGAEKEERE